MAAKINDLIWKHLRLTRHVYLMINLSYIQALAWEILRAFHQTHPLPPLSMQTIMDVVPICVD